MQDAEARLQGDLGWAFLWAAEKYATRPCVDAQMELLSARFEGSGPQLEPTPVLTANGLRFVVRMPNRPYRFPAWDSLVADGTATHLSVQRQNFYGRISDGMVQSRLTESDARRLMGRLMVVSHPIELDTAVRANVLGDLEDLRNLTAFEALNAQQRMRLIADGGGAPSADVVDSFLYRTGAQGASADFSGTARYCKSQGLPLAGWREFKDVSVNGLLPGSQTTR